VELNVRELSEEPDGALLQVTGQTGPNVCEANGRLGRRRRMVHGGPSQTRGCQDAGGHPSHRAAGQGASASQRGGSGKRPDRRSPSMI
jgi:hypothetical protein